MAMYILVYSDSSYGEDLEIRGIFESFNLAEQTLLKHFEVTNTDPDNQPGVATYRIKGIGYPYARIIEVDLNTYYEQGKR